MPRHPLWVGDLARGVKKIFEEGVVKETFNFAGPDTTTAYELARKIEKEVLGLTDAESKVKKGISDNTLRTVIDIDVKKAEKLGINFTNIDDAIREMRVQYQQLEGQSLSPESRR